MDGGLGAEGAIRWIAGVAFGALLAGFALAALAAMARGRRQRPVDIVPGIALAVAIGVVLVVLARAASGDATGWDWVWAAGCTVVGAVAARALWSTPRG